MTKICLYAICGDNERDEDLDRWFETAQEADYALILFTGTNSHILKKLSSFKEKHPRFSLIQREFDPFRFDIARNASIEFAEKTFPDTDVFFTIDIDEWMAPGWTASIKNGWKLGEHQRICYKHRHFEAKIAAGRNWGHAPGWRWKYPCHEVMIRGYDGEIWFHRDTELLNLDDKLEVVHYRDPSKPRSSYLELLEIRWEEYKDPESLTYLVREYMYNRNYDKIKELESDIKKTCKEDSSESCMSYVCLGDAYEQTGDMEKAEVCYIESINLGNRFRRGYSVYGRFLIEQKRPKDALDVLKRGLEKTEYTRHVIFVDPSDLWTWHYWDWMCVAAYWSDKGAEALEYALKAHVADPENRHVQINLKESYKLLAGDW